MDNGGEVLSQHAETEGFNIESGKTWIYPTNLPIRDYQYSIVNEALLKNTMVCLPTGLGKTFIAAVVMYNYYRWYPHGKIIFMAPTKPLVKQQVEACYNIMAIPTHVTAELTGTTAQSSRDDIWEEKRVFFITPQVLQNDLERITRLSKQIKCLVFDEAHKARGNHAYCEIVKKISPISKHFRVLALTATPGSNISEVVKVCNDLLISHIEIRTEDSVDVAPFVFKKNIQTVVVQLDSKLCQVRDDYIQVLDKYVRILVENRVMQGNCSTLTKGRLFYIKKEYEEKNKYTRGPQHNEIMKNLSICLILYHAYEVLTKHGLRGFLMFFKDHEDNPLLRSNNQIRMIINDISNYLGPIPVVDMLPDGTIPEVPKETKFGHPKFYKLAEILNNHFNKKKESKNNQVIVFCEYRESVMEAYTLLLMYVPLIKPRIFLGQGTITQKQQINVIQSFRSGDCNTLVSTSIGEEGLDIGDVNLVVCFDISNKSSIRMIQRIGRTGRKQEGNVIMLVTEGKEHQLLRESFAHKDYMIEAMKTSKELYKSLHSYSAKMIPDDIKPVCNKMFITVDKPKQKLKNTNLMSMFDKMNQNSMCDNDIHFENRIPASTYYFNKTKTEILTDLPNKSIYNVEKNRILHSTYGKTSSSANSKILVSLLEFANAKRYNIPLSQSNTLSKQTSKNNNFIQSDIRTMFQKQQTSSQADFSHITYHNINENNQSKTLKELQSELNEYLSMISLNSFNCKICDNLFKCTTYKPEKELLNHWIPPDIEILDSLTKDCLDDFVNGLKPKNELGFDEIDDDILAEFVVDETHLKDEVDLDAELADIEIPSMPIKTSSLFDLPKSAKKLLMEYKTNEEVPLKNDQLDVNINKNDTSDIFAQIKKLHQNTLDFFALNDLSDLYSDENQNSSGKITKSVIQEEIKQSWKPPENYVSNSNILKSPINSQFVQNISAVNDYKTEGSTNKKSKISRSQSPDLFDDSSDKSQSPLSKSGSQPVNQKTETVSTSISIDDIYDTSLLDFLKVPETKTIKEKLVHTENTKTKPKSNNSNQTKTSKLNRSITNKIEENKSNTIIHDIYDDSFLELLKVGSSVLNTNFVDKQETSNSQSCNSAKKKRQKLLIGTEKKLKNNTQDDFNDFENIKQTPEEKSKKLSYNNPNHKKPTSKEKKKSNSLNINDIFDTSILLNDIDDDHSRPQTQVCQLNKNQSKSNFNVLHKSEIASNNTKKLNMNQSSSTESNKKMDHDFDTSTSPILSSYENNIRKSRLKLLHLRETKSPKTKIQCRDNPLVNCEDIFGDFLSDISSSQSSQSVNKHLLTDSESIKTSRTPQKMGENLESNRKNKIISEDKHTMLPNSNNQEKNIIKNKTLIANSPRANNNILSPQKKVLTPGTPKSVNKELNVSEESDTTLIISPETLSMFSEMRSSSTHRTIDDDDFESPTYSSYSHKSTKTQSRTKSKPPNVVKPSLDLEDIFDFYLQDIKEKEATNFTGKCVNSKEKLDKCKGLLGIPNITDTKEDDKKKNLSLSSVAKTAKLIPKEKSLTNGDIFDFTHEKISFGSTNKNILNETCCENVNKKNNKGDNMNKNINYIDAKSIMKTNKYGNTLEWLKKTKNQYSPIKSKFQFAQKPSMIRKFSSPNSKVTSKSNPKTPDKLCKSPVLNRAFESPISLTKQNVSASFDTPNSTRHRKRCLTESPKSPVLSGTKRRKMQHDPDDDFEESTFLGNKAAKKRKPLFGNTICISSDDDFETSFVKPKAQPLAKGKKKKGHFNDFLDTEAALSSDASISSDERSGSSQDVMEESFVNDNTLDVGNNTMMHAHYLQAARSPVRRKGYKIPELPAKINPDIFSQNVNDDAENAYLEDSFCVGSDESEASQEELSELEIAERILKEKRMKKDSVISLTKRKHKRILEISSDSD